jgi:hypothetical protein
VGGFEVAEDITDTDAFAFRLEDLDKAPLDGRGDFHGGLVGFQNHHVFVPGHGCAFGFEPVAHLNIGDRFADGGDFKFEKGCVAHEREV